MQLPIGRISPQMVGIPVVNVQQGQDSAEKPKHERYLREFRTNPCQLFAERRCTQHRPYTCFDWHFPNQKRRRPIRRPDGTFNYNADVYCEKYNEKTGLCPDGDACPYVHRNAGDTERRYHPRYFRTGICHYETSPEGHCVRNGEHCAFAHGLNDLRPPVYDQREVQSLGNTTTAVGIPTTVGVHGVSTPPLSTNTLYSASLEKERALAKDAQWNNLHFVLQNYKTTLCPKTRVCRQGYACPFFHTKKDRRRHPITAGGELLYRGTACPVVKSDTEWLESDICDRGDSCPYCHTRTEQQFHPEVYKSTKCNDIARDGFCPRGPFCAFFHDEKEMSIGHQFMFEASMNPALRMSTLRPIAGSPPQPSNHLLPTSVHSRDTNPQSLYQQMLTRSIMMPHLSGDSKASSFSERSIWSADLPHVGSPSTSVITATDSMPDLQVCPSSWFTPSTSPNSSLLERDDKENHVSQNIRSMLDNVFDDLDQLSLEDMLQVDRLPVTEMAQQSSWWSPVSHNNNMPRTDSGFQSPSNNPVGSSTASDTTLPQRMVNMPSREPLQCKVDITSGSIPSHLSLDNEDSGNIAMLERQRQFLQQQLLEVQMKLLNTRQEQDPTLAQFENMSSSFRRGATFQTGS